MFGHGMGHFVRDKGRKLAIIQISTPNISGTKYKPASGEARGRLIRSLVVCASQRQAAAAGFFSIAFAMSPAAMCRTHC